MRALTPAANRIVRGALLTTLVLVSVAVAFTYRRAGPVRAPEAASSPPSGAGASFSEVVYRSFREGKESFVVKARRNVGEVDGGARLLGVEVSLPGAWDGRPTTTTVVADEALYDAKTDTATFRGHVKVATDDGLELLTESLVSELKKKRAETGDPVQFTRGRLGGTATGLTYDAVSSRVDLGRDVVLRSQPEAGPPAEVRSARAVFDRNERQVRFEGDVVATQGTESLKAGRLTLHLSDDLRSARRAVAIEDVDVLAAGAGSELPGGGSVAGARGPRRLRARKLEMWFRDDGSLLGATARPDALLEVRPGPAEPAERRLLSARRLDFEFDPQGRLQRLEGRIDVSFRSEAAGRPVPRTLRCQGLQAELDPESGAVKTMIFTEAVEFSEGPRRALAGKGVYDEARSTLFLTERPRLLDDDEGSDLRAEEIDVGTRSRDVVARRSVRHQVARKVSRGAKGGLLARDEPVLLLAQALEYQAASRTGRYRGEAVLRSGKDEIRAPVIVLEEPASGQRRLTANGGVVSLFHPKPSSAEAKAPAPVEVRAKAMVYEEANNRVVYKEEVVMRQGDIVTKSPEATLFLTADGARVEAIVAGEPVDVRQGERTAKGTKGTYTPENETLVLVGEKVLLSEPGRQVEGRSLTFQVGAGRALVDGQEEVRTESVFRRATPHP